MCVPVHVKVKEKGSSGTYGRLTYTYFHSINQRKVLWGQMRESLNQTCVGLREEVTPLELDMNLQLLADNLRMHKKEL